MKPVAHIIKSGSREYLKDITKDRKSRRIEEYGKMCGWNGSKKNRVHYVKELNRKNLDLMETKITRRRIFVDIVRQVREFGSGDENHRRKGQYDK